MFAGRYFPTRFFADRYWCKVGATATNTPGRAVRVRDRTLVPRIRDRACVRRVR